MSTYKERRIGEEVFVIADNFGSKAVIVDQRPLHDPGLPSQYKVKTWNGALWDEFWAYDWEIYDLDDGRPVS